LGRDPPEVKSERAKDKQALDDLHESFTTVSERTERLEAELRRVNRAIREQRQLR
jgi:predicted  nucleic acid-binding Zn-ribbon protein